MFGIIVGTEEFGFWIKVKTKATGQLLQEIKFHFIRMK